MKTKGRRESSNVEDRTKERSKVDLVDDDELYKRFTRQNRLMDKRPLKDNAELEMNDFLSNQNVSSPESAQKLKNLRDSAKPQHLQVTPYKVKNSNKFS